MPRSGSRSRPAMRPGRMCWSGWYQTGLAHIEHAWLTGDLGQAGPYPELLLERTDRPGTLVQRGELLVYLRRLGYPAEPFPGCREPYVSALRGDWRSAAECVAQRRRPVRACRRARRVGPG